MKYDFNLNHFIENNIAPEKLAVAGSDKDIIWSELELLTLQLKEIFATFHIPQGHPIVIYGHKEALYPAAMLACIHSNIPYIPIDKIYPKERIKKIVENTKSQILINCSEDELDVSFAVTINASLVVIQNYAPNYQNKIYGNAHDPLRYIMFTSGSTGEPKGVMISKSSFKTFVDWSLQDYNFNADDVFMNQAPFTFDVSLCDVLNAFMRGASLVLTSNEILKNQDDFINRIKHYECSVWTSTPSFAYLFMRHPNFNFTHLPLLNTFLFMGEPLPNRTCVNLKQAFNQVVILNAYGPTEATIVTTLIEITDEIIQKYPLLPIGKPMPASQLLVSKLNEEEKEGEIIIVGNHVSDGYFNDEDLTNKKFYIYENKKAFKTGDLGYYQDDLLFCLGRNDDQVKMNGFRIELDEISHVILKNEMLADAICVGLSRNNEVKKIIAFIILKEPCNAEELINQIKLNLQKNLPYYMIPSDFVIVDTFPVNVSHKFDKNKLIAQYLKLQFGE